jgi:hypothetical protein
MLDQVKNSHFQEVIEKVESLPDEEQKQLIELIKNRLQEKRRRELVQAVQESRQAFVKGEVKGGTVDDLMAELDQQ